jgi:hypothetical protein
VGRSRRGNKRAELDFPFVVADAGNWLPPLRPAELGVSGKVVRVVGTMTSGTVTGTFDLVLFNGPYNLSTMATADVAALVAAVDRRCVYLTGMSSSAPDDTNLRATSAQGLYAAHASSSPAEDLAAETVGVSIKVPATVTADGNMHLVLYAEDCD